MEKNENSRSEKYSKLSLEVRKELNQEIAARAKAEDISKSELVRRCIRDYLKR